MTAEIRSPAEKNTLKVYSRDDHDPVDKSIFARKFLIVFLHGCESKCIKNIILRLYARCFGGVHFKFIQKIVLEIHA